jgi:D-alanine-D-alanine ligase/UDP-N-acetylmuramate--alanine ligase
MKVAVIHGGFSTEQAVSTKNAHYVEDALKRLGHTTEMVLYDDAMIDRLRAAVPDLVFLCVQGKGHGDGTLQGILDFLHIPYTGSQLEGAAIINDKIVCKELFEYAGIRTPLWQTLSFADWKAGKYDFSPVGYPFVAKAPTQGGSYGIELIGSEADMGKIKHIFEYDDPVLIERFIPGFFVTVALLNYQGKLEVFKPVRKISDPSRAESPILLAGGDFSTEIYDPGGTGAEEVREMARNIFAVTGAKDYARIDFMVSHDDGLPYALEINAVPGLKPASLFPRCAEYAGLRYDDVIETLLLNAVNNIRK